MDDRCHDGPDEQEAEAREWSRDESDMLRMGIRQELRREYQELSAIAFMVILQGSWQVLMVACNEGLTNGGLAGVFWSTVWTFTGMTPVVISLAEMVSMAPASGGQYRWVSEFAPPEWQRSLSYYTGWVSTMSWQAGAASGPYLVGTLVRSVFDRENGHRHDVGGLWETGLVVVTVLAVYAFNCHGGPSIPMLQNVMFVLNILGLLVIVTALTGRGQHNSLPVILTDFSNLGGWSSMALSLMVGQKTAVNALTGFDAAAHLSEEVKNAGSVVPRAMLKSHVISGSLGFVFTGIFLATLTDVQGALEDDSGYPFLFAFREVFSSTRVKLLGTIVIVLLFAGTVSYNLSSSRQVWAVSSCLQESWTPRLTLKFARDNGLPWSSWIAAVDEDAGVPVNASRVTAVVAIALSLINLGSNAAFNAIISLNLVCLMCTYTISIACVLHRRICHPALLPKAQWSLGRAGTPANIAALAYSAFVFFWSFWPISSTASVEEANWAIAIFPATLLAAKIDWDLRGRHVYFVPGAECNS